MLVLSHCPTMHPSTVNGTFILLLGRLDTSDEEALRQWVAPAFHVKASECLESSGFFHVLTGGLLVG
jgi:hypothetical protein